MKGGQRGPFAIFGEGNTFGCNGRRFAVFAEWVECSLFSYFSDFKRLGANSRWVSNPGKFTNNAFCGGRVVRDVAGAASKHGLLLVDWWFGMQGFPRAFCGITANRGLFWGIGGLGCRESRGLVGFAFILAGWGGSFGTRFALLLGSWLARG